MEMAMSQLPEDILLDILSRLPKKSQRRSQVVSKEWRRLITESAASFSTVRPLDQGFYSYIFDAASFLDEVKFYCLDSKGGYELRHWLPISPFCIWSVSGSTNGVLFYSKMIDYSQGKFSYHLHNPVTNFSADLYPPPNPFVSKGDNFSTGSGLALDPDSSSHYKFILVYTPCGGFGMTRSCYPKIAIYSSETGEWETKLAMFDSDSRGLLDCGCWSRSVYIKGSLYWNYYNELLVIFYVKTEFFRVIELPYSRNSDYDGVVWESEERRVNYCQVCEFKGLSVWVLDDERAEKGSKWRRTLNVSLEELDSEFGKAIGRLDMSTAGGPCQRVTGVSAFFEHHQIVRLRSTEGIVSYDIAEKRMSMVKPGSYGSEDEVPFTFTKFDLPAAADHHVVLGKGRRTSTKRKSVQLEASDLEHP
ncbi:hypothetical protein H6P81_019758 [Aristolochia fimbriata]|uniref:F-box domain-containing protein n=1 Tax=Aristolochia fimbriata TaxID=158543 RepID=A0AAV7DX91_ARIFI|nr:hypothetical protein H6P81_019758 [Aristolochia fimbriata]